jgi:hypothetical protein
MRNAVVILLAFGVAPGGVSADEPASIKVVKTWKDLHDVPPIHLGGGVKVRLGLEAATVPQWSRALLYCLTDGYTPSSSRSGPTIGPVFATFHFVNEKETKNEGKWGSAKDKVWPQGSYLFAGALPVDCVGSYDIKVTDRHGKMIARGTLEGTKEVFHPWMPWFYLREVEELARQTPAKGIALPRVDEMGPIAFLRPGKMISGNLPTLLPTKQTPKLTIRKRRDNVIIQSEKELHAKHPQFHFLARWWVNDNPFVPQQTNSFWESMRRGILVYEKELSMPLSFDPALIGAKPGDKVGLQILYCQSEWGWCAPRMLGGRGELNRANLRLSNRIDFVVTPKQSK